MTMIIDVSHWQVPSAINYDKICKEIDAVVIRTQYGSKTIDRHYKTHHKEFQKRGIPTSAYAWVRGVSIKDMEKEATDFYNRTKEFDPEVYFLDVEEISMKDMRAGVKAYAKKLRQLGAEKVGVYIANHLYKSLNIDVEDFDCVWIPHYGKNNGQPTSKPSFPCDLQQYTDKGRLAGYNGPLDLNRIISGLSPSFFGIGEAEEKQEAPKAPAKSEKPKETPQKPAKTPAKTETKTYTYVVKKGDTLGEIAAKVGSTVTALAQLNKIKNVNVIHVGQQIKYTKKVAASSTPAKKYHTVKAGDTVGELAAKYGSSIANIKKWNNLNSKYLIIVGQKLRVK